ncbi:hypothetical protein QVD17_00520 [Tagetes erecta]|uniref:Transmembrane protein n=1 Tax=Tagetes erecta TaxID=13708 RepID=A0AAD8L5Y2_TARER|nr:hypothetical protein QVD17_00520 [Tagetes erecta]
MATRYDLDPVHNNFSFQITVGKRTNMHKHVSKDIHEQLMIKFHIIFTSCCLFLYCAIVTITSSNESYAGHTLRVTDAFFKASRNWKTPLVTSGCVLLLTLGIYAVNMFCFAVISFLLGSSHVDSVSLFVIAVVKWMFDAHVGAVWIMSLVVTVIENDISGLKAINRAWEVMNGKRIKTTLLMMLYYVACLLVRKSFDGFVMKFEELVIQEMWGLKIPFTSGFDVFLFVLYTVFYRICKEDDKVYD